MAKKRRKPRQSRKQREDAKIAMLRQIIREATKTGAVEAIEHCGNFWSVSDGYKRYIDDQIETQAEALIAAVKIALRQDRELANARRKRKP